MEILVQETKQCKRVHRICICGMDAHITNIFTDNTIENINLQQKQLFSLTKDLLQTA
jgi:hypothetical protein